MARLENAPAQGTPGRDMRAWEVARLISEYVAPATTILFGSRAKGAWHDLSDIDIAIIHDGTADEAALETACLALGKSIVRRLYDQPVALELVIESEAVFDYYRKARNSLQRSIAVEGTVMGNGTTGYEPDAAIEPDEWPETALRLRDAQEYLQALEDAVTLNRGERIIGVNAHQALEHALKAVASAAQLEYREHRTHDLETLTRIVAELMDDDLLDFDLEMPAYIRWFAQFAGTRRYRATSRGVADRERLMASVRNAVHRLTELALTASGKTRADIDAATMPPIPPNERVEWAEDDRERY